MKGMSVKETETITSIINLTYRYDMHDKGVNYETKDAKREHQRMFIG